MIFGCTKTFICRPGGLIVCNCFISGNCVEQMAERKEKKIIMGGSYRFFLVFMLKPSLPPFAVPTLVRRMTAKPATESELGIVSLQFCQDLPTTWNLNPLF